MRFCKSCGSIAANDDEFCVICGAKIDEEPEIKTEVGTATESQGVTDAEVQPMQENTDDEKPISESKEQNSVQGQHVPEEKTISAQEQPVERAAVSTAEEPYQSGEPVKAGNFSMPKGNPNRHDDYVDISSFAFGEAKKQPLRLRAKVASKAVKKTETKVVKSIADVESKTREVGSIKSDRKKDKSKTQNDEYEDIASSSGRFKGLSKRVKISITACCGAFVVLLCVIAAVLIIKNIGPTAEELYASAQQKYSSEDYYGAIEDLSRCVELDVSDVDAYMLLADAYIATNREQEAASALEIGYRETGSTSIKTRLDALNDKLHIDNVYNSLIDEGNDAVDNRDYNLAVTKFTSAAEVKPDIAEPYLLIADAYVSMEDYDKALECLQNALDKVDDNQEISSKIDEISAIIEEMEAEEAKRLEEKRKAEEEALKQKEAEEQAERERIEKQPVAFETKIDEKTIDYEGTDIFRSDARWVEFSNEGRNLPGIDYANKLVQDTLDSYYEFDKDLFGVKNEKELYDIVKNSRNVAALTHCRITVTYNKNGILSFVIYKYYVPPTILGYMETAETHTIDLKTGSEYDLSHILANPDDVNNIIREQAELSGIQVNDQRIANAKFFLAGDSLMFYMKNTDWEFVEVPLPYTDTEKFAMQIEEDTETTYLYLQ